MRDGKHISLLQAQQMARAEGFIINRRGSTAYWLKLVEGSQRQKASHQAEAPRKSK